MDSQWHVNVNTTDSDNILSQIQDGSAGIVHGLE